MKKNKFALLMIVALMVSVTSIVYGQSDTIISDPNQIITSAAASQLNYDLTPKMFKPYNEYCSYVWGITFSSELLNTTNSLNGVIETKTLKKGYIVYHGYDVLNKVYVAYWINHEIFIDTNRNINTVTGRPMPAEDVPFAKEEIIDLASGNTTDPKTVITNMANLKTNLIYNNLKPQYAYGFFYFQQFKEMLDKEPAFINISLGATIEKGGSIRKLSPILKGCNDSQGQDTNNQLILDRNWPPGLWQ